jgi:multidrug efflux pump subunit AcrA (membrane-fusion protein)
VTLRPITAPVAGQDINFLEHIMRPSVPIAALAALLSAQAMAEGPVTLATAEIRYRTVAREYRLDGVVEAVNRTTVSAQTQGQVEEILYDVNDVVEKGAVVAPHK